MNLAKSPWTVGSLDSLLVCPHFDWGVELSDFVAGEPVFREWQTVRQTATLTEAIRRPDFGLVIGT